MTRPSPHQHHSVVNRNAALARERGRDSSIGQPVVNSQTVSTDHTHLDLEGRMKVRAARDVKVTVPHDLADGVFSYEEETNPINQLGALHSSCVPLVTSGDFDSFMAAFNKRCNFEQSGPDDDIDDAAFAEALEVVNSMPSLYDEWDENDADRESWLAKFDDGKRRRMEAAYADICGSTPYEVGKKDLSVKQEVLVKRDDPSWAPRIIYAGNDVFNAVTGPASAEVMRRLVHLTRTAHRPIGPVLCEFAYKTNDVALMDFLLEDETLTETVEGDFSRNDREQRSRVALIYDAWLAKLAMPQWFRTLLLDLEHFRVQSLRYGFRADLKYQLPTGTTSTTPRNSTYNATMFAVACKRQGRVARAVILGDDILARMDKRFDLDAWVKTVADFKMVLKAKAPRIDGDATFLSRRLFADVARPCMVPLLGKMLVRFNIRSSQNDAMSDSQYMAGKALSYAYECRHVPFLRDLFLSRFTMEGDHDKVDLSDLTWFARSSGARSAQDIVKSIANERVLISDDEFGMWCCLQYDLDFEEVKELFFETVLNCDVVMLDLPNIDKMLIDVA